ncbi:DNA replication protein [Buchnera aphidicola (Cinara tujafilina)]|uniref:DNA replication protein n=1 Tax=Buchnera aphidicola (Cinara tujafilina) TaxID=261317 RepID=F7WYW2_9GAMM|nr:DNA replication protein [Buchnera aphidicola (Cinara tujafilina)]
MPHYITPKFYNDKDLLLWNQQQGQISSISILRNNQAMKMQKILGRSGIRELYINCSFENYNIKTCRSQKSFTSFSKICKKFKNSIANFIFSGNPGTGKNHLAAAIGNYLILNGNSVLIITVADLMSSIKKTFSSSCKTTEEELIHKLCKVDLLIIDEIGVQIKSRYEKIIINQIIDRRSSTKKSTGMLSNLDYFGIKKLLGERVIDRMRLGHSLWLTFDWSSYRKNITGHEY